MQNTQALKASGFNAEGAIRIEYSKLKVEILSDKCGTNSVQDTSRGELIEIRNKTLAECFSGLDRVIITFRSGKIIISASKADIDRLKREARLSASIKRGKVTFGSLYSGIGLTSLALKLGLKRTGLDTVQAFSTDIDELALSVQVEGNPIWEEHLKNAVVIADDISNIDFSSVPQVDVLEIGYPCYNQSTLCPKTQRDLEHPKVGSKFIPTVNAIKQLNPAVIIIECAVPFLQSKTYSLIKKEIQGYQFEEARISGYDHGDFEERKRCFILATSKGLNRANLDDFQPKQITDRPQIKSIMETVPLGDKAWKEMQHVKDKLTDPRLNFKHKVYSGNETKIAAIPATYNSPKIGSPMIQAEGSHLQRLFTYVEHSRIREVPKKLFSVLDSVAKGKHPLVSKRGNVTAVQRMLGNGVSPKAWRNAGEFVGRYLISQKLTLST
ncbi:DNA cytosine methyltransferase [Vibrio chagasii]|uniref:DNA cytosine methyltransferase n=1 Tax=Vibrio chagasii TaxID=170679 RepID=UPI00147705D0|nr:DNA cytosine methyltransferase [Vibrio chagasii]